MSIIVLKKNVKCECSDAIVSEALQSVLHQTFIFNKSMKYNITKYRVL